MKHKYIKAAIVVFICFLAVYNGVIIYRHLCIPYTSFDKPAGKVLCFMNNGNNPISQKNNNFSVFNNPLLENKVLGYSIDGEISRLCFQKYKHNYFKLFSDETEYFIAISKEGNTRYLNLIVIESRALNKIDFDNRFDLSLSNQFKVQTTAEDIIGIIDTKVTKLIVCTNIANNNMLFYNFKGDCIHKYNLDSKMIFGLFNERNDIDIATKLYSFDGNNVYIYAFNNGLVIDNKIKLSESLSHPLNIIYHKPEQNISENIVVYSEGEMYVLSSTDHYNIRKFKLDYPVTTVDTYFYASPKGLYRYNEYGNKTELELISEGIFKYLNSDLVGYDNRINISANYNHMLIFSDNIYGGKYYSYFTFDSSNVDSAYIHIYSKIYKNVVNNGLYLYTNDKVLFIDKNDIDDHLYRF